MDIGQAQAYQWTLARLRLINRHWPGLGPSMNTGQAQAQAQTQAHQ